MKNNKIVEIILKSIFGLLGIVVLVLILGRESFFNVDNIINQLYDPVYEQIAWVNIVKSVVIIFIALTLYPFIKMIALKLVVKNRKIKTIIDLILSLIKYIVGIIVILMVLKAFGVDTQTLIASCGILALIIGLGCQSLVSDVVSGLFIVFEGDFKVGDIVVLDGWRGTVETIGIRTTKVVDALGNVMIINNSDIHKIINNTKELSVALCDCGIEYDESIERVELVIAKNLDYMKKRIPAIVEGPFYQGVQELGDSSVVLRLVAKCKEENKFQVQRDMNRELKLIFDKNKVNIPFPQVTVSEQTKVVHKKVKNMDDFVDKQKEASANINEING